MRRDPLDVETVKSIMRDAAHGILQLAESLDEQGRLLSDTEKMMGRTAILPWIEEAMHEQRLFFLSGNLEDVEVSMRSVVEIMSFFVK